MGYGVPFYDCATAHGRHRQLVAKRCDGLRLPPKAGRSVKGSAWLNTCTHRSKTTSRSAPGRRLLS
jgi:hypothetical protein